MSVSRRPVPDPILLCIVLLASLPHALVLALWITASSFIRQTVRCSLNSLTWHGSGPFQPRGKLMAASVWSGYLTFGLISMPVRLFSGARSSGISFNMLHRDDHARVKQQLTCSADGKVLERNEIVKGYEYRKGEYVIIEPDEIKKIEPKTAKTME